MLTEHKTPGHIIFHRLLRPQLPVGVGVVQKFVVEGDGVAFPLRVSRCKCAEVKDFFRHIWQSLYQLAEWGYSFHVPSMVHHLSAVPQSFAPPRVF